MKKKIAKEIRDALTGVLRNKPCPVKGGCAFCYIEEVCGSAVALLHQVEKKLKEAGA